MDDILGSKFQLLRAYLEGQIERRPAVIMVSSTDEDDGRRFVAHGLADSFKRVGQSTALLHGDGPSARPHVMGNGNSKGGSELSYVRTNFDDAQASSHDAIAGLLHRLRDTFAFVVVDAPPLLRHPSVMVLAGAVDAVLLTVRQGRAALTEDELVVKMLKFAKANLVGVVAVGAENIAEFDRSAVVDPERIAARSSSKALAGAPSSPVAHLLSMLRRS